MGSNYRTTAPRWRFPEIEGFVVNNETGQWSTTAFWSTEEPDNSIPEVWCQAPPHETNRNVEDWRRWIDYLETDPKAAKALLTVALFEARKKVFEVELHVGADAS